MSAVGIETSYFIDSSFICCFEGYIRNLRVTKFSFKLVN
jgi:hypothetical protein